MSRWKSVALALAIFLSGAVAGAGISIHVARRAARTALEQRVEAPQRLAAHMRRRLDLTAAQEAAVARVLEERRAAWISIREDLRPRIDAELGRLHDDVGAVLDDRQRAAWTRWFERRRGGWLPRRPDLGLRPPPPRPPPR